MPKKVSKLLKEIPDYDYTEDEEFVRLAMACGKGNTSAMAELSNYFEKLHEKFKD